ncbi:MAG: transposase [Deltaproteobacteria bacterium]|nr:transposase [Deltaproteobacteria bacterium]
MAKKTLTEGQTSLKRKEGGTGFQPVSSFKISRRNLPHWQEPNRIYFLTWRCRRGQILDPEERTITLESLRYWDGYKWTLYAAVIMPDHVHALAQPLVKREDGTYDLGEILHSVKSFSAHKINRQRGAKKSVWQDERFDRIVRDEMEFNEKWQYIRNNPVKNGLSKRPEDYPWFYEMVL